MPLPNSTPHPSPPIDHHVTGECPEQTGRATTLFNPSPEIHALILSQLADHNHSLISIAAYHDITIEALTLWMARPEINQAIANIENAASRHLRLAATCQLPRTIPIILAVLRAYEWEESHQILDKSFRSLRITLAQRHTALRATSLLLRLSRHTPPNTNTNSNASVSPPTSTPRPLPTNSNSNYATSTQAAPLNTASPSHTHATTSATPATPNAHDTPLAAPPPPTSTTPPPPATQPTPPSIPDSSEPEPEPPPSPPLAHRRPRPNPAETLLNSPDLLADFIDSFINLTTPPSAHPPPHPTQ